MNDSVDSGLVVIYESNDELKTTLKAVLDTLIEAHVSQKDRIESVIVRYPDHVETIFIAPTRQRCVWHEVTPKPINSHRADKTRRVVEWREAYRCKVGNWPTNEQTAEAIGCSVSTVKYHLKKVREAK